MVKNNISILPLFANPLLQVELDLDTDRLTEFAFEMQNKDKRGVQISNIGGWQSNSIIEETHEELGKLKKEISHSLQMYHSEIFQGMKFKTNVTQTIGNMWTNINEKHHYNEWHIHGGSTLSGVYYIKHDGSIENGEITFKHPYFLYSSDHWPAGVVEENNLITMPYIKFTPRSNMLFIFPSWLEHKVEPNSKNESRISVSFNSKALPLNANL